MVKDFLEKVAFNDAAVIVSHGAADTQNIHIKDALVLFEDNKIKIIYNNDDQIILDMDIF